MIPHTEFKQYSDAYWEFHRGKPSASNYSKIVTSTGKFSKSSRAYIAELIAEMYDPGYPNLNEFQTSAMRSGTVLEPSARRFYEFERDCEVEEIGCCESDDGRLICSPDGLVPGVRGLELKSPKAKTHAQYLLDGKLPSEYVAQVHGSMIVTGLMRWDFMSFCPSLPALPPLLIEVEYDEFTEAMREALGEFLIEYDIALEKIAGMIPPPPPPPEPVIVTAAGFEPVQSTFQDSYF